MRSPIWHHLLGILSGIAVTATAYYAMYRSQEKPSEIATGTSNYQVVRLDDILGLARVSATKALDRQTLVKWAYFLDEFCNRLGQDTPLHGNFEVAVTHQTRQDDNASNKETEGEIIANSSNICSNYSNYLVGNNDSYVLTSSIRSYRSLKEDGITPVALAVSR